MIGNINYPFMCFSLISYIVLLFVASPCWSTESVYEQLKFRIEADSYSENQQLYEKIFRGDVKLIYDDIELTGDRIVVTHNAGKPMPEKIIGSGNIKLYQKNNHIAHAVVECESFVLNIGFEKIIFKSAVSAIIHGKRFAGSVIYYDIKNKRVTGIIH